MHYRMYLVTVRMKVLQNWSLSNFQRRQSVGVCLTGASVNKTAILLGLSTAAVAMVPCIHKS